MYARTVDGREVAFGVSGSLWKDALVLYDRPTRSLWSQVTGRSIQGAMKGRTLQHVPSVQTTWQEWKRTHPGTLVLKQPGRVANPYIRYESSRDQLGVLDTRNPDSRLPGKELVLGIRVGEVQVAYPLTVLRKRPILNTELAGKPILVVLDSSSEGGQAFTRSAGGKVLTFESAGEESGPLLRDVETRSLWDPATGKSLQGPLKGVKLVPVVSLRAYWFAWRSFFPTTELGGME